MHEHNLTPHSLYTAVLVGLETETIIAVLSKLSKTKLPKEMIDFIHASTANYRKVKFILKNWYFIKSPFPEVLKRFLADEAIAKAGILSEGMHRNDGFTVSKPVNEIEGGHDELINEVYVAAAAEEKETHSFEIDLAQVENVKQRCLPNALNYVMIEEYDDLRNDTWMISINPSRFEFHNGGLLLIWPSWLIILILKNDLIYKRKNGVNLILSSDSPLQVSQFLRTFAMQNWQTYLQLLVFASESGTCFTRSIL